MKNQLVAAVLLAVCSAAVQATPAQSEFLTLRYASTAAGVTTQLVLPVGGQRSYVAGNYNFETQAPGGSFLGYCADPFQWASGSFRTYEAMPLAGHLAPASARYDDVTNLFGHAYEGSLLNATKAAGFQLALWEVMNDDGNLATGVVRTTAKTSATVVAEAQALLAGLPTWTGVGMPYELTFYANPTFQDYIAVTGFGVATVPAIPEPESYALMLAGLGLLGWTVRRRRQRGH